MSPSQPYWPGPKPVADIVTTSTAAACVSHRYLHLGYCRGLLFGVRASSLFLVPAVTLCSIWPEWPELHTRMELVSRLPLLRAKAPCQALSSSRAFVLGVFSAWNDLSHIVTWLVLSLFPGLALHTTAVNPTLTSTFKITLLPLNAPCFLLCLFFLRHSYLQLINMQNVAYCFSSYLRM